MEFSDPPCCRYISFKGKVLRVIKTTKLGPQLYWILSVWWLPYSEHVVQPLSEHSYSWCSFLDPYLTTHRLNIGCIIKIRIWTRCVLPYVTQLWTLPTSQRCLWNWIRSCLIQLVVVDKKDCLFHPSTTPIEEYKRWKYVHHVVVLFFCGVPKPSS